MKRGKIRVPNRYKHGRKFRGNTISADEYDRRLQQSIMSCGKEFFFTTSDNNDKGIVEKGGDTILVS